MNTVDVKECPPEEALLQYLYGSLSQPQCDAIGVHLSSCDSCESTARQIESSSHFRLPFSIDDRLLQTPMPGNALDLGMTGLAWRRKRKEIDDQRLVEMFDIPDYEIVSVIGRGGMGVVFKAKQKSTNRIVALKVINPGVGDPFFPQSKEVYQKRFASEIAAAASIDHDNVVTVHDGHVGDELQYCVMQLVEGSSLEHRVRNELDVTDAVGYVRDAALGIQAAHELDILHRDVKPQNILISERNNRAMVSDFGLAKNIGVDSEPFQHTKTNTIVGTLDFMSPEQVDSSSDIGKAADIYSLGATLYFCLTGVSPFASASVTQQMRNISEQIPVSPRRLRPDIHSDLDAICLKCLEKRPVDRYQSASELASDIDRFLSGRPTVARPAGVVGRSAKWCRRNPLVATLLATVALLLLFAFVAGASVVRSANAHRKDLASANKKLRKSNEYLSQSIQSEKLALGKAEAALSQTRKLALDISNGVAESPELLQGFDGMQDLRRELLTMAKNQLEVLLDPDRRGSVTDVVDLQLADATLARQLGKFDESDQQLVEAEKLCRAQLEKENNVTNQDLWRYRLAKILYGRGVSAVGRENYEEANQLYRNAWESSDASSLNAHIPVLSLKVILGSVFGKNLLRLGKQKEALSVFDRAEKSADLLYEKIKEKTANGAEHREFKSAYNSIIQFLNTAAVTRTPDKPESFRRLTKCEEVFKNIAPDLLTPENRKLRAGIWMNLSIGYRDLDPAKSIELRKLAVREFRELAELNPKISDFKYNYVKAARNLGKEFASRGDDVASKKQIDEASAALAELMEAEPNSDRYISLQALLFGAQAIYHGSREEYDEAATLLNRKLELNRTLLRKLPKAASRNYNVGFCHFQLAECATVNSRPVPAFFHILAATTYSKKLSGGAKKHLNGLIAQQFEKLLDSILLLD